ncbi:hypothetical protein CB0940_01296 [Cercospora beticola]|uniref:SnoaL-like domain-containing protein n=1 Tax=Cercospora beticola TaxID=122368 RepID=A0A2G5I6L9_CERBT|nr:hypothetical protein CB0940_01296 [Cercospora beticola]PIB00441.1 hypothetical protein CB0940_01296 [Cercospora beticola]WPA96730.1 hypothetical protein RHO25_001338 [Cercospora beticola]CAK1354908.1 unnamed protein product [Cercospora beticola]
MSTAASDASPTSTTSSPVTSPIEQHLIKLTSDIVVACNARQWDPKTYPWTHIAADFVAGSTFATLPSELDFAGFLHEFSLLYGSKPEFYVRPVDITANVSEKTGKATVFANFENVNFTPGVLRYSVGRLDFQGLGNGRWVCVRYMSVPVGESPAG